MRQSYHEVTEYWNLDEVCDAHTVLDSIYKAKARAERPMAGA
jgi:hypothetical protein